MRKYHILALLLGLQLMARGQTSDYDYFYWFDTDTSSLTKVPNCDGQWTMHIDVTKVSHSHLHTLSVMALDADGRVSQPLQRTFVRVLNNAQSCYWFDSNASEVVRVPLPRDGVVNIDVSRLSDGFHTLYYHVVDGNDIIGQPAVSFFFKIPVAQAVDDMRAMYWFDTDTIPQETSAVQGVTEIDVNQLADGLHTFHYIVLNGTLPSNPIQQFFYKGNSSAVNYITEYTYWVNDLQSQAKRVTISGQENPLTLVTMLQPPSQPLRSSQFYFEMTDGLPTVYPVNDLHLRFTDLHENQVDTMATYADLSSGERVTNATLLESGVGVTTTRPATNAIKWYRLEAQEGDELRFRLNTDAALQLFAPSGEEVEGISGATEWETVLASERGTYYVALHDMEDATASTVTVNYERTTNSLPGDVNGDGSVDIGDIVMVISVMTGSETRADIVSVADVNGDGAADIGDIVAIINIMTSQTVSVRSSSALRAPRQTDGDRLVTQVEGDRLHVALDNTREYTAFQFVLTLPEGASAGDITMNAERASRHIADVQSLADGRLLVMGYSMANQPITGSGGELLSIQLKGRQSSDILVSDILFADASGKTFRLGGDIATGVTDVETAGRQDAEAAYDLLGRRVVTPKGIILIGTRKVLVK